MTGQTFKTVYFPAGGSDDAHHTLTLAFPERDARLLEAIRDLSSLQVRQLLELPTWDAVQARSVDAGVGPSTYCVRELRRVWADKPDPSQLSIWDGYSQPEGVAIEAIDPLLATYRGGDGTLFHDWFPYLEGYAPNFVDRVLQQFAPDARLVLDPFGGTGTTPIAAAASGRTAFYCEINPRPSVGHRR